LPILALRSFQTRSAGLILNEGGKAQEKCRQHIHSASHLIKRSGAGSSRTIAIPLSPRLERQHQTRRSQEVADIARAKDRRRGLAGRARE